MDANEITALVDELEDRVERLRALYDQYFMGIERLEPLILRKEVDRRIWQLRREPIRNTALRFKLQTIVQRYNTYQQHWQRVCREIENGTYYRDVSRAAARFGDVALTAMGRKRQKMFEKGAVKRAERNSSRVEAAGAGTQGEPPAGEPESAAAAGLIGAPGSAPPVGGPRRGSIPAGRVRPSVPAAPVAPLDPPLGLDLESLADLAPLAEQLIDTLERTHAPTPPERTRPIGPPPHATTAGPGSPLSAKASQTNSEEMAEMAGLARARAVESAGGQRGGQAGAPLQVRPATPGDASPSASRQASGPSSPRPHPESDLTPAKLRELYGSYVEAKRRCHESTAGITFERLCANLRQTADTLRARHPGRQVAFEVVIKNGSAVLKAVVKG